MENKCFTLDDYRCDGILSYKITLGNFVKDDCRIPTINFIDSTQNSFFVYIKDIEYEYLYKQCMELQNLYGFDLDKIKEVTNVEDYSGFRLRPIICSTTKTEFYTIDIDYLNIQNIDLIC